MFGISDRDPSVGVCAQSANAISQFDDSAAIIDGKQQQMKTCVWSLGQPRL